jgi:hypothetical protein
MLWLLRCAQDDNRCAQDGNALGYSSPTTWNSLIRRSVRP